MAVSGLNAASSLAIVSRAVVCMMNKYGPYIIKTKDIKEMLVKNAGGSYRYTEVNLFLRTHKIAPMTV